MQFTKAERKKAKLRLGLTGASGSGKTYSALMVAKGMGGKVAVIDTEHGSASLYANDFDFDTLELEAPYTPERYIQAIEMAEQAGYNVLVIDSISHEWNGKGGCLEINDNLAIQYFKGNTWSAWSKTTPRHQAFIEKIISSKIHIIATMRSKTETVQENKKVFKVGMKSEQRDGVEYEFTTILDLNHETHNATASKDRTKLFTDIDPFLINESIGEAMMNWLNTGADFYMSQENQAVLNKLLKKLPSDSDIVTKIKAKYPSFAEVENAKFEVVKNWLNHQLAIHQTAEAPATENMPAQPVDAAPATDEAMISQAKALESELTKAINVMTLEDANDVKFFLERSQDKLAEITYTVLESTFNSKFAELEAAQA